MQKFYPLIIFLALIVLTACTPQAIPTAAPIPEIENTPAANPAQPSESGEALTITVVYTNDEHGWMAGEESGEGAAELAGIWAANFSDSDYVIPISGGDNWTGPAISTWYQGESMVEVMDAMGYAATAVGNHEFDFGIPALTARADQAQYPFLGANIRYKDTGEIPTDIGIQPYTIIEKDGLQIGIVGLANIDTPAVTNPVNVSAFEFEDYAPVLQEVIPELRQFGVDFIIVPTHICQSQLTSLASRVGDLDIDLFGGGHCHEEFSKVTSGSVLLGGGSNLRSYAYATFTIDPVNGNVALGDYGVEANAGGQPHPQIAEIVAHWQGVTDAELDVVIGYLESEIPKRSDEMAALITESWLWAYPADVAITNWGGMRDRIPAGEITFADIISVLPFENVLMDVSLTGEQLVQVLESGDYLPAVGGLYLQGGKWHLKHNGAPIDPAKTYNLLTTDFMYAGGDNYRIAEFDPDAYNTAINWRQPIIDWILAQESSAEQPLNPAIDELMH